VSRERKETHPTMKKLFLEKNNTKNLIGGVATLAILGLIAATTFIVISPACAKNQAQTSTQFCRNNRPSGVSQSSCLNLVNLISNSSADTTMLESSTFTSALRTFLKSSTTQKTQQQTPQQNKQQIQSTILHTLNAGDLTSYCKSKGYDNVSQNSGFTGQVNDPTHWFCVSVTPSNPQQGQQDITESGDLTFTKACKYVLGTSNVKAQVNSDSIDCRST